eukprot:CAMPEP_0182540604 /NCGR_PEP_ID=MMETSP1323-20130603/27314_1 /TAXON_ID=236787 /ORGANISM="Florenciella parvula, Strain RCC1693" /LENGTH=87 /DNA_ID=CAMNT_0024751277 /DNA_START=28 /DNA_END=288 /DNA_ORIENTATION=-
MVLLSGPSSCMAASSFGSISGTVSIELIWAAHGGGSVADEVAGGAAAYEGDCWPRACVVSMWLSASSSASRSPGAGPAGGSSSRRGT